MLLAILRNFRLLSQCKRDPRPSRMLRSVLVVSYRRFGTSLSVPSSRVKQCNSSWTVWPLKVGTDRLSLNYQHTPSNIPEELKSRFISLFVDVHLSQYNKIKNEYPCYHITAL